MQFIDLAAQQAHIRHKIDARIAAVLDHGKYIMGPEVREFEEMLAAFCGAKHCISCANGTDALLLALMALNVDKNDAVFVPAFTFAATAEVVPAVGATPVFVDCDADTYNMDPASLERAIKKAKELGLTPSVVIPVDLFGLPANYPALTAIAENHGIRVIADSAQGFGGMIGDRMTGTFGEITTTSFFPAKPLGCYGDGGALFTDDDNIAVLLDSLRVHGKGTEKYDNVRIGVNSRLDTIQAAILIEKLAVYADELDAREKIAARYTEALGDSFKTPFVPDEMRSIWAQYTLLADTPVARSTAITHLKESSIPSVVYYPKPLNEQTAYRDFPADSAGLAVSSRSAGRVFSLPMHPYLSISDQDRVIKAVKNIL